ncbi:hypothetical protein MUDAN_BIHEEGNE_03188 [Lactiplantibacillus mudanjiangensis]|uniref:hypothetical protein n=1 Tax=Lactiplantibacillus mudanjiangensis TaxID=1296538 RepID=UPI00101562BE|nr:hypothetical protein MUDAN_BIHEEGNE_03188 [Lactiplantibacillus mudanjiangensis]
MALWSILSMISWIILAIGIIMLIIQMVRHKPKRRAFLIGAIGLASTIVTGACFLYFVPTYAGVSVERADYELIQRATKDGHALVGLNYASSDKKLAKGNKAASDLATIISDIPANKQSNLYQRLSKITISNLNELDLTSKTPNTILVNDNVQDSMDFISSYATFSYGTKLDTRKVFHQMLKDSGIDTSRMSN